MKTIIAITGPIGAGKDTVAEYISKKLNIPAFEMSGDLKDVAKARNIHITRESLIDLGRTLVFEKGVSYLPSLTLARIQDKGIITGIRQVGQIEFLRQQAHTIVIGLNADIKTRFERTRTRGRYDDCATLEEFKEYDRKDNKSDVQNIDDCMKIADVVFENNASKEELFEKIDEWLQTTI